MIWSHSHFPLCISITQCSDLPLSSQTKQECTIFTIVIQSLEAICDTLPEHFSVLFLGLRGSKSLCRVHLQHGCWHHNFDACNMHKVTRYFHIPVYSVLGTSWGWPKCWACWKLIKIYIYIYMYCIIIYIVRSLKNTNYLILIWEIMGAFGD